MVQCGGKREGIRGGEGEVEGCRKNCRWKRTNDCYLCTVRSDDWQDWKIRLLPNLRCEPFIFDYLLETKALIDLSVNPSLRTQMSQWQSSISCMGTGTQASLGFSAIEKHWKIQSSHRFDGVYATNVIKQCSWGTCNTDSRYPERIGSGIWNLFYYSTFIFWLSYSH